MSGTLQGADLEALDRLATQLDRESNRLTTLTNQATAGVTTLDRLWDGPDSAQFRQQWLQTHRPKMNLAVQELQAAAATIQRNRQAQEQTSAADGASGGTWGVGPALAGGLSLNGSLIGDVGDFLFGDLANFWTGGEDGGFPTGSALAALLKMNRIRNGQVPIFNTGLVGRGLANLLQRGPGVLNRAGVWLGTPGATTAFTRLGIAGGVVGTGLGLYDLYQQGNPIDAFQENGAGYVADVASTAFSASTTAFLIAPNPVTGALALGTGAVWLGAEVVDNWDEISEWGSDVWDAGSDFVSDVGDGAIAVAEGVGNELLDAGGSILDAGGSLLDAGGGLVSSVSDWF